MMGRRRRRRRRRFRDIRCQPTDESREFNWKKIGDVIILLNRWLRYVCLIERGFVIVFSQKFQD